MKIIVTCSPTCRPCGILLYSPNWLQLQSAVFDWKLFLSIRQTIIRQNFMCPLSLAYFLHALCWITLSTPLKCLIQLSASTWQQSVTSAVAEQLPTGLSTLMNHLVRSQDDISLLECAMKRELSRAAGPWGIWLWIHGGWIVACSCVDPEWMSPRLCPDIVLHLGRTQSRTAHHSRFCTSSLIWVSDGALHCRMGQGSGSQPLSAPQSCQITSRIDTVICFNCYNPFSELFQQLISFNVASYFTMYPFILAKYFNCFTIYPLLLAISPCIHSFKQNISPLF